MILKKTSLTLLVLSFGIVIGRLIASIAVATADSCLLTLSDRHKGEGASPEYSHIQESQT